MKVAIPTDAPGGLEAVRSGHFGHCDIFTVVSFSKNYEVEEVIKIINEGHEAGGCLSPVKLLKDAGVEAIVVAGLGMRPMQAFTQVGITVYYADPQKVVDVAGVIDMLKTQGLVVMHPEQACQGSANCQH